jgi:ACS family pantothenate transporter-like MFS transporter
LLCNSFNLYTILGVQWILGSWYKPDEIGKRTAIFTSSGLAGTLFSGIMQGAIYRNLNGKSGLAGWRWLFVIDFLITLPVAIYGFLIFPDTPTSTRAKYLTPAEKKLAVERLPEVVKERGVLGWSLFRRVLLSWHWWAFVWLWIAGSNTEMFSTNAIMQLWLRGTGDYSIPQVNYIPSSVSGMGIVATLTLGWYTDWNPRHRWHVGILLSFTAIISGALMLNPPTRAAKFAALIINGFQYAGQTVFFAWANDLTRQDDAKRSVVIASMNMLSIAFYMWWSIVFYNATQGPDWYIGSCAMLGMGSLLFATTLVTFALQRRQEKHEAVDLHAEDQVVRTEEASIDKEKA